MSNLSDTTAQPADGFVASAAPERRDWLSVLAKARPDELLPLWERLTPPEATLLRAPEVGMVMVRGRAGGAGAAFNLGEMTVTRCAVRLATGATGIGYVSGRDKRHAHAAAIIDAMMQSPALRPQAEAGVIAPLKAAAHARTEAASRKAKATQVEFFTMVRDRKA
ncbi:MAG: phosphonate C-P lyase system protein PhnG [Polymorphobacter sp.]|uniref:phosphonate C-P lyase system protein PhnG n=1 Tax=Polymorphobacter sp. TaxID=1909290 RepID=UPI003A8ABBFA